MSKVRYDDINKRDKYQAIGDFYEIISNLNSKKESIDFFIGLLTPSEALMLARRIQIGKRILEGKKYDEIRKELKVGFSTITKTENWIHGGSDKYSKWIEECLRKNMKKKKTKEHFKGLLDKYPEHRILKNILN